MGRTASGASLILDCTTQESAPPAGVAAYAAGRFSLLLIRIDYMIAFEEENGK
jgi:hypothetical protein